MSRDIGATNLAALALNHIHPVILVKLEFTTPVYVHNGIGTITYDSNDYLGVGTFGSISNTTERLKVSPTAVTLSLSGIDSALITEALDSGSFGDVVTIYDGFRQDDGTLIADPFQRWRGTFDHASASTDEQSVVSMVFQSDHSVLGKISGRRFSNEDHLAEYPSDTGFQFAAGLAGLKLAWGGRVITTDGGAGGGNPIPRYIER